jgi:beta-glucosidase
VNVQIQPQKSRNFIPPRAGFKTFLMKFQWLGKCFILSHTIRYELKRSVCIGFALFFLAVLGAGCASTHKTTKITVTETMLQDFTFPKDFLWGAGTSSHQVEGNNTNNDWWQWEQHIPLKMRSGQACDEWNRFEEDFKLAGTLGLTAYRFSLEWSRIQPSPGQFDNAALDHYREMILSLKSKGIEPIVTLDHFTIPLWLVNQGGWLSDKSPELFAQYVQKATAALGSDVHYWITLNEPAVYTYKSYMIGLWPPGEKSTKKAFKVVKNLARAHVLAYVKIKEVYAQKGWRQPLVGIAQQVLIFAPCSALSLRDRLSAGLRDHAINHLFVQALIQGKARLFGVFSIRLPKAKTLDFIGLNYYTREYVRNRGFLLSDMLGSECVLERPSNRRSCLGWEIYPQGLYTFIKDFSRYKLPILISENGICTTDDTQRSEFIVEHLKYVALAMKEGAHVIGYLYWSLLDNYEWADGFAPRFGLIEVDYTTQERKIRESARKFEEIIRTGKPIF